MHSSVLTIVHSRFSLLCFGIALLLAGCGGSSSDSSEETAQESSDSKVEWAYTGERGPEAWGDLSSRYATCSTGTSQSPVALDSSAATSTALPALSLAYGSTEVSVTNTGHSFNAAPPDSQMLSIGEETYHLVQFHQHTPSEHTIGETSYPIELHFVHKNEAGELAVVGVVAEVGVKSEAYQPFVQAANKSLTSGQAASASVDLASLLPDKRSYYTYDGSLTTPPCTEGVRWIVLEQPVTLSEAQIDFFAEAHGPSSRPVQPLGERTVRVSE